MEGGVSAAIVNSHREGTLVHFLLDAIDFILCCRPRVDVLFYETIHTFPVDTIGERIIARRSSIDDVVEATKLSVALKACVDVHLF